MPLHPQARDLIDKTTALNLPAVWDVTLAQARETVRQRSAALPREDVASVLAEVVSALEKAWS